MLEDSIRQHASFLYLYQPLKQLLLPISTSLESLEIDAYTGNSETFTSLELQNLPCLRSISISAWSFVFVSAVLCKNNPQLKHVWIKDHCFCLFHKSSEKTAFSVLHCKELQDIHIEKESFKYYRSAKLEGEFRVTAFTTRFTQLALLGCGGFRVPVLLLFHHEATAFFGVAFLWSYLVCWR